MGGNGSQEKRPKRIFKQILVKRRPLFWILPIFDSISGPGQGLGLGLLSFCYCGNNRAVRVLLGSLSQWLP